MKTQRTGDGAPDVDSEQQQLQTLKARIQRLEKELEGLQDALYRHEVLQDKTNAELLRRTEQIEHQINQDARRHLL
jgi:hypothetical protein